MFCLSLNLSPISKDAHDRWSPFDVKDGCGDGQTRREQAHGGPQQCDWCSLATHHLILCWDTTLMLVLQRVVLDS